jgi:hypothetical protein
MVKLTLEKRQFRQLQVSTWLCFEEATVCHALSPLHTFDDLSLAWPIVSVLSMIYVSKW